MEHEAARPKGRSTWDDEPSTQPMRPAARGQIARNPSTDQKRVRRANNRKVADWTPGHVTCSSCGYTGHPVLGDGTSANCARCGSYSVSKTRPAPTGAQPAPDNARYLHQGDYGRMAAKTATVRDTQAEWLNPGDQIRTPNGKTQKVLRVRPHEQSAAHVYIDTDSGTAVVRRSDRFQVSPDNNQQQSLPGYGIPGGNTDSLPGETQLGGTNNATSTECPVCGGHGTLARQGNNFLCSRCGYRESFGGAGGHAFTDSPQTVRTFSTINTPLQSVIARRARQVLDQKETP